MNLKEDLYDIYKNKIASKNDKINKELVQKVTQLGKFHIGRLIPITQTSLFKDTDLIFGDKRYGIIFEKKEIRKRILNILVQLKLEEPIVDELLYMLKHYQDTYKHVFFLSTIVVDMITAEAHPKYNPLLAAYLSLTHDIGKNRIPQNILDKKTHLTHDEYDTIKTHPTLGYLLLNYYCGWEGNKYCNTAYEHHEKLDGSGYPRGIKKIDPYAKLIAPIDILDALISDRPYREKPYSIREAIDFLIDGVKENQLDKNCVYSLVNCLRKDRIFPVEHLHLSKSSRSRPLIKSVYGKHIKNPIPKKSDGEQKKHGGNTHA